LSWFFYVVECRDGSYYAGISKDPEKRIHEHNFTSRGAKYTTSRRPVILKLATFIGTKSDALKKEISFKKLSRKEKQKLIEDFCHECSKFSCDCS